MVARPPPIKLIFKTTPISKGTKTTKYKKINVLSNP